LRTGNRGPLSPFSFSSVLHACEATRPTSRSFNSCAIRFDLTPSPTLVLTNARLHQAPPLTIARHRHRPSPSPPAPSSPSPFRHAFAGGRAINNCQPAFPLGSPPISPSLFSELSCRLSTYVTAPQDPRAPSAKSFTLWTVSCL
jgi:hypothetical protein